MQENRIGVPTLQKLIAEANDLTLDRIPLKTLQRFLGDTHRSNDVMVRFCHRFAAGLEDDDPLDSFGEALVSFWGVHSDRAEWEALTPDMIGTFYGRAEEALTGMQLGTRGYVPFSSLVIDAIPAQPYARAIETITNWSRLRASDPTNGVRRSYEGVLFHPPGALLMVLRNSLTGAPRLYWLDAAEGPQLIGYGHESTTPIENRDTNLVAFNTARVIFERAGTEVDQ